MKKILLLFLAILVFNFSKDNVEENQKTFVENVNNSLKVYNETINQYKIKKSNFNQEEIFLYDDNYSGCFIDENGLLNIGVVNQKTLADKVDEKIIYQAQQYSFNYLKKIYDTLTSKIEFFDIFEVSIDEKLNQVVIRLKVEENANKIIAFLEERGLYNEEAINIILSKEIFAEKESNVAYAGDSLNERVLSFTIFSGTICANARDNETGKVGVLTNDHVAYDYDNSAKKTLYAEGWLAPEIGTLTKRYNRGSVDAAFIPFEDQDNWNATSHARFGKQVYENINLGNEDYIIQGLPVRKIGQTTGDSTGTIQAKYTSYSGLTGVFSYSNKHDYGDSGGPVYYENDGTLFLIGMHTTGEHDNNKKPIGNGFACRITDVINVLNVTPITNELIYETEDLSSSEIKIKKLNFVPPTGEIIVPESLFGKKIVEVAPSAFADLENLISVTLPYYLTTLGRNAFSNCINLTEVILPEKITVIEEQTFENCINLKKIFVPKNLTTIKNYAFYNCNSLSEFNLVPSIKSIDAFAFKECTNLINIHNTFGHLNNSTKWENHKYLIGKCECGYEHTKHNMSSSFIGAPDMHYRVCLDCGYIIKCSSEATLLDQTSKGHEYYCYDCGYFCIEEHNIPYNSRTCIRCLYEIDHDHNYSANYIPATSGGIIKKYQHYAYCNCGEAKLYACYGYVFDPFSPVYCLYCHQEMGGSSILFSIALPNGVILFSSEEISFNDSQQLLEFSNFYPDYLEEKNVILNKFLVLPSKKKLDEIFD